MSAFLLSIFLGACSFAPGLHSNVPSAWGSDVMDEYDGNIVHIRSIEPDILNKYPELTKAAASIVPQELLSENMPDYILGSFDVVTVTVWEHPELTQPLGQYRNDAATGQVIDKNGLMYYPYIGTVKASGLTTAELRKVLQKKIAVLLKDPQLDVKVLSYRNKKVYVGGEVQNPGMKFISDLPMTVPWAINQAGGLSDEADGSVIYLTRGDSVYMIDLVSMYRNKSQLEKIVLSDGDKIHVSSREETKVFMMGEVSNTTAIPMFNGRLSLSQALAEVGGLNQLSADAEEIYVLRSGANNLLEVFHLNAENPLGLILGERFKLRPRDIVYVDTHALAQWNRVIGLLLPTMTLMRGGSTLTTDYQDIKNKW